MPEWAPVTFAAVTSVVLLFLMVQLIPTGLDSRRDSTAYHNGVRTTGTIVEVKADSDTTHKIRVEFNDASGKTHRFTKQAGDADVSVGDKVAVSYKSDDPSGARDLTTNKSIWKYQLLPAVIGVPVLVVTDVVAFVLYRRRQRGQL